MIQIKEKTPELFWEVAKETIIKDRAFYTDDLVKRGFKESLDEAEKWQRLSIVLAGYLSIYMKV